jgi:hypothetical protein
VNAHEGDWLVVDNRRARTRVRHGVILTVHGPGGAPPYTVRWTDNGDEALVFPAPESRLVPPAEQAEFDRLHQERLASI